MLVRVCLPDSGGRHFLTTLSPRPLSSTTVWRASTARNIEIDVQFAKLLRIQTLSVEVEIIISQLLQGHSHWCYVHMQKFHAKPFGFVVHIFSSNYK